VLRGRLFDSHSYLIFGSLLEGLKNLTASFSALTTAAVRSLDIPGGTKMIQEYYRQMRKFGCNILAVIQQYDIIKESAVRGAMIGNSKTLLKLNSRLSVKPLNPLVDVAQITCLWIRPLFRNEWHKESIRFSD
jgi:hypothetical protein